MIANTTRPIIVTKYGIGETRLESTPVADNLIPNACAKPKIHAASIQPRGSPAPIACAAKAINPRPATMSRDQPIA